MPADFRWFISTHGRGYFQGTRAEIPLAMSPPVSGWDGLAEWEYLGPREHEFLYGRELASSEFFPPGMLSCAGAVIGGEYYFQLDGSHGHSVWYWEPGTDPLTDLVQVAEGFTDLLASSNRVERD